MLCIPPHQARDFAPGNHNYESYDMIQEICRDMALRNGGLDKIIFQTNNNIHGKIPLVFGKIAKDSRILLLVQSKITIAQESPSDTKILPASKHAGQRMWGLIDYPISIW